jgi:hypothetical protein
VWRRATPLKPVSATLPRGMRLRIQVRSVRQCQTTPVSPDIGRLALLGSEKAPLDHSFWWMV